MCHSNRNLVATTAVCLLLLALFASPAVAQKTSLERLPGYVDGAAFLDLVGDDAVTVEVSIHGSLLKALLGVDPDLKAMAGGLESIHAVILEVEDQDTAAKIKDLMRQIESKLMSKGWQRMFRVKEEDAEVKVLVLNDEEAIHGLVVLIAGDDDEFVFANIAGILDLAAIAKIGESFDIPGLDELGNGD